ncbi:hypothetical protein [Nonomuraea sp. NPDC050540]|uniref:hypothetical protein n=1 Tax=Nonomuraea sp. NPDC050540 TaxID=3364367 RepID=UPI0037B91E36
MICVTSRTGLLRRQPAEQYVKEELETVVGLLGDLVAVAGQLATWSATMRLSPAGRR